MLIIVLSWTWRKCWCVHSQTECDSLYKPYHEPIWQSKEKWSRSKKKKRKMIMAPTACTRLETYRFFGKRLLCVSSHVTATLSLTAPPCNLEEEQFSLLQMRKAASCPSQGIWEKGLLWSPNFISPRPLHFPLL